MKNVPEINLTVSTPAEQEKYHTLDLRKNKNNKIEKPTKVMLVCEYSCCSLFWCRVGSSLH